MLGAPRVCSYLGCKLAAAAACTSAVYAGPYMPRRNREEFTLHSAALQMYRRDETESHALFRYTQKFKT